ncbi:MAG: DUF4224 domain-containing protein [Azoarcus sp.]|nr:DUF4224 domain-containing protein [Azoarcus sp.]
MAEITRRRLRRRQIDWLNKNGWSYLLTAAGHPVVGRRYAELKLAGVAITAAGLQAAATQPNFAALD